MDRARGSRGRRTPQPLSQAETLDAQLRQRLSALLEHVPSNEHREGGAVTAVEAAAATAAAAGTDTLDPAGVEALRTFLRSQRIAPRQLVPLLLVTYLPRNHARIRHATLLLVDTLYQGRQPAFRNLVLERLEELVQWAIHPQPLSGKRRVPRGPTTITTATALAADDGSDKGPPPTVTGSLAPATWARRTQLLGIRLLLRWQEQDPSNVRLALALQHVRHLLQAEDLSTYQGPPTPLLQQKEREHQLLEAQAATILREHADRLESMAENAAALDACLRILVPPVDANLPRRMLDSSAPSFESVVQSAGLVTPAYTLHLALPEHVVLEETPENAVLIDSLRQHYHLLCKHVRTLHRWVEVLVRSRESEARLPLVKELLDRREELAGLRVKVEELRGLRLDPDPPQAVGADGLQARALDDEDDDEFGAEEFVEVPMPSPTLVVAPATPATPLGVAEAGPAREEAMPAGSVGRSGEQYEDEGGDPRQDTEPGPPDPERAALLAVAPVVEFDEDLYYWDKPHLPLNQTGLEFKHRFLGESSSADKFLPESTMAELRRRTVVLRGERPAHIPACRAPLKVPGSLCPRRDLYRCPVHGPIVPRDDDGIPLAGSVGDAADGGGAGAGQDVPAATNATTTTREPDPLWMQLERDVSSGAPALTTAAAATDTGSGRGRWGKRGAAADRTSTRLTPAHRKSTPSSRLAKKLHIRPNSLL